MKYRTLSTKNDFICVDSEEYPDPLCYSCPPQRFTGFLDKFNQEIYQGDILEFSICPNRKIICSVEFNHKTLNFEIRSDPKDAYCEILDIKIAQRSLLIGNCHQNATLMNHFWKEKGFLNDSPYYFTLNDDPSLFISKLKNLKEFADCKDANQKDLYIGDRVKVLIWSYSQSPDNIWTVETGSLDFMEKNEKVTISRKIDGQNQERLRIKGEWVSVITDKS